MILMAVSLLVNGVAWFPNIPKGVPCTCFGEGNKNSSLLCSIVPIPLTINERMIVLLDINNRPASGKVSVNCVKTVESK